MEPSDSEFLSDSEYFQPEKKRKRRVCDGCPKERILQHFSKLKEPTTWLVLKQVIPGNKSLIWKLLVELVSENKILQHGAGKRGDPYFFELASFPVCH
jgi:hypothetical protein